MQEKHRRGWQGSLSLAGPEVSNTQNYRGEEMLEIPWSGPPRKYRLRELWPQRNSCEIRPRKLLGSALGPQQNNTDKLGL